MFLNNFLIILTNMDNNSKFLLSMIILIIILLILIIIISAVSAKKEEKVKTIKKPTDRSQIEDKLKKLDFQLQSANVNKDKVTEIKKAPKEPIKQPLEEEIEVIAVEENDIEKIAQQIENSKPKEFDLNEFEREQEESAIISYDELVKKAGAKKIVYKKEEPKKEIKSNFTPSKVVSPIYGVQNKEVKTRGTLTREERNKTLNTDDNEVIEDIEFLNNLKQFRRELQ